MNIKSIIALFMGLVIQLSQVQSCMVDEPAESCVTDGISACCCGDLQSCPCLSDGDPAPKPAPLTPGSADLKLLISKAPEPCSPAIFLSPSADGPRPSMPLIERWSGYVGVPLSVAFCRFTI